MEASILDATKKTLGLASDYTAFDHDVITHINSSFSVLNQIGVGPVDGFGIEGAEDTWDSFEVPLNQLNMVKTYIYLKVRMLFDPPTTSFHIDAMEKQIREHEVRLNGFREAVISEEEEVA